MNLRMIVLPLLLSVTLARTVRAGAPLGETPLDCGSYFSYLKADLASLPPPLRNRYLSKRKPPARPAFRPMGLIAKDVPKATHLERIESLEDFHSLARSVGSGGGAQKVVKVVYQRGESGGIHFLDTNTFQYHYQFATEILGYRGGVDPFNKNYVGSGEARDFNLASLILSRGTGAEGKDELLLEIWT